MTARTGTAACIAGLFALGACGPSADRTPDSPSSDSAAREAIVPVGDAPASGTDVTDEMLLERFQEFLDSSVVTRLDSGDAFVARPERCELDAIIPNADYLLAAGRALSIRRRGPDSATVRAEIVSVGNLNYSDGPLGVRVAVDVRTVRIEWEMLRDADGDWGPCGYASTGRDFGRMGDGERDIRWTPRGAGWATIARLSDSVRRAQFLPVP